MFNMGKKDDRVRYSLSGVNTNTPNKRLIMRLILEDYNGKSLPIKNEDLVEEFLKVRSNYSLVRIDVCPNECECGHRIYENCMIKSAITNTEFTIGNDCIRLFGNSMSDTAIQLMHTMKEGTFRKAYIANFDTPFELMDAVYDVMSFKFGKYHTYRQYKEKGQYKRIFGVIYDKGMVNLFDIVTDKPLYTITYEKFSKLKKITSLVGNMSYVDATKMTYILDKAGLPTDEDFKVYGITKELKYDEETYEYIGTEEHYRMPWGKYEGDPIESLPDHYLDWLNSEKGIERDIVQQARLELLRRGRGIR